MGVKFDRILDGFDGPFAEARWTCRQAAGDGTSEAAGAT